VIPIESERSTVRGHSRLGPWVVIVGRREGRDIILVEGKWNLLINNYSIRGITFFMPTSDQLQALKTRAARATKAPKPKEVWSEIAPDVGVSVGPAALMGAETEVV